MHDGISGSRSEVSAGAITTIHVLMRTGSRRTEIMAPTGIHAGLDKAEMYSVKGKTGNRTIHRSRSAMEVFAGGLLNPEVIRRSGAVLSRTVPVGPC